MPIMRYFHIGWHEVMSWPPRTVVNVIDILNKQIAEEQER